MNIYDFIYNLENDVNYFESDDSNNIEKKIKAKRTTADLAIKNESKYNSYSFLALNMFRSCYARYIFAGMDDEKKAMDLLNQLRSTICRNVIKKSKDISFDEHMPQAKWYNLVKEASIRKSPKPEKPKELEALEERVKWMTADPLSKIGKEVRINIGKTFGIEEAKMVGYNGEIVTKWSINLIKKPNNIQELEKEISSKIIRSKQKDDISIKDSNEDEDKEIEEKPKENKIDYKKEISKISGDHLKQLEGSSRKVSSTRNMVTNIIVSILKSAKNDNVLRDMMIYGKGQGGRYTGEELTSTEYVYMNAVKMIINGIAYEISDIAVRGLIEIEVLNAVKICKDEENFSASKRIRQMKDYHNKDFIPFDEKDYRQISSKIKMKLRSIGITEMPNTMKINMLKWIKMADMELEKSGFDDHIRSEICHYFKLFKGTSDSKFEHSKNAKIAIIKCSERIADSMLNDSQFVDSMTKAIIDIERIKELFAEIDPDLAEKMKRKRKIYKKDDEVEEIKSFDDKKEYKRSNMFKKSGFIKPHFYFKKKEFEKPESVKENNILSFYEFIEKR